ncbi:hypothetical protein C8P63_14910 [Melghirimyces profundicolus]|uniref:Uncharacterized protein n=1 Tax=Melghirimyces profundicolus TaxID=1242148 RepID=A0A2T6AVK1_9BACL|nr:hypothetical protein [Melghirimyces profundicolus]PTX47845.1 hypothetical protein C8P63_14910 [Melghirimyces profundicolus]
MNNVQRNRKAARKAIKNRNNPIPYMGQVVYSDPGPGDTILTARKAHRLTGIPEGELIQAAVAGRIPVHSFVRGVFRFRKTDVVDYVGSDHKGKLSTTLQGGKP